MPQKISKNNKVWNDILSEFLLLFSTECFGPEVQRMSKFEQTGLSKPSRNLNIYYGAGRIKHLCCCFSFLYTILLT